MSTFNMDIPSVKFFFLFPKYCGPRCSITFGSDRVHNQADSVNNFRGNETKKIVSHTFSLSLALSLSFFLTLALVRKRKIVTNVFFRVKKRDRQKYSAKYRFVSRKETAIRQSLATRARQPVHLLNLTLYVMLKDNAIFI